jgi:anti-sigma factor RsiW
MNPTTETGLPFGWHPQRFLQACSELAARHRRLSKKYARKHADELAREHFTAARRWQARRAKVKKFFP